MSERSLPVKGNISFEALKKLNEHSVEFWSAPRAPTPTRVQPVAAV